jgi:hypothetical protein
MRPPSAAVMSERGKEQVSGDEQRADVSAPRTAP